MYFDWITWGLWLVGFAILITWIYLPTKEIKHIIEVMHKKRQARFYPKQNSNKKTDRNSIK